MFLPLNLSLYLRHTLKKRRRKKRREKQKEKIARLTSISGRVIKERFLYGMVAAASWFERNKKKRMKTLSKHQHCTAYPPRSLTQIYICYPCPPPPPPPPWQKYMVTAATVFFPFKCKRVGPLHQQLNFCSGKNQGWRGEGGGEVRGQFCGGKNDTAGTKLLFITAATNIGSCKIPDWRL